MRKPPVPRPLVNMTLASEVDLVATVGEVNLPPVETRRMIPVDRPEANKIRLPRDLKEETRQLTVLDRRASREDESRCLEFLLVVVVKIVS